MIKFFSVLAVSFLGVVAVFFLTVHSAKGASNPKSDSPRSETGQDQNPKKDPKKGNGEKQPSKKRRILKWPGIEVNMADRSVRVEAKVINNQGIVEYFGVLKGGKEYESFLVFDCDPLRFNLALILIGLKKGKGPKFQGDSDPMTGDLIRLKLEWKKGEETFLVPAEKMIFNNKTKKGLSPTPWIYTGGRFMKNEQTKKNEYSPIVSGSLIATFPDPDAIINNPSKEAKDDQVMEVNPNAAPAKNSKVILIIIPEPKKKPKVKKEN